jgi:hypothetical protein
MMLSLSSLELVYLCALSQLAHSFIFALFIVLSLVFYLVYLFQHF